MNLNIDDLENPELENSVLTFNPDCVRKKSNWTTSSNSYKFDNEDFSPQELLNHIPLQSPKLKTLLDKITKLDKRDQQKYGTKFKHFIFSDLKSGVHGAKLLASALIASGFDLGYFATPSKSPKKKYGNIQLKSREQLLQSKGNNFYLLSSVSVYDQPISTTIKKNILSNFNERPTNIYGNLSRIIIMDSGFKEGIDLFDIKYIHIFEPSVVTADQKQVIGRGTRTCGQKGLDFHPTRGWPLYVFIYDLLIPEPLQNSFLGTKTGIDLYLKAMNLDLRLFHFSHDLEKTTVLGSVDYELNKNIHSFTIPDIDEEDEGDDDIEFIYGGSPKKMDGGGPKRRLVIRGARLADPEILSIETPRKNFQDMRQHIREHFKEFEWTDIKMENLCGDKKNGGSGGELIKYSPSQDFIRHYFTTSNPCKGMLLWNSVGTGKTCSAIAAATNSFEKDGYTILWVTRTTLKNDIWKNMFDQVCNESIRHSIQNNGLVIPTDQKKRIKLLSNSWRIRPMSYKQFSNLVSKQNNFYKTLVKINGELDPLRKTLIIIDEAHKLYGGGDLSSIERPDMNALHSAVMKSYMISGKDSVRLLLMTATPITQNPMELIQLLNLCKSPNEQMPAEFAGFANKYLNETGEFSAQGKMHYLDDISGYVSYLNREKDARQFSQPIVDHIPVPITEDISQAKKFDKKIVRNFLESDVADLQSKIEENNQALVGELSDLDPNKFIFLKDDMCHEFEGKPLKLCHKIVKSNIKQLVAEAKEEVRKIREGIKEIRNTIKERNEARKDALGTIRQNIEHYEDEYNEYKTTPLYALKNKCATKITKPTELYAKLQTEDDELLQYNREIDEFNQKISELHEQLKTDLIVYKMRMDKLKKILKTDLSELERSVINMTIQEVKQSRKNLAKIKTKAVRTGEKEIKKSINKTEKKKKLRFKKIKKTIKLIIKTDKKHKKTEKREELKLRKTMRKQGEIKEEIQHELLQNLLDKYKKQIGNELQSENQFLAEKDREKENKRQEKEMIKQHKRTLKEQEREHKRQEKEIQKEHKRQQKETLKLQKLANKTTRKKKT